MRLDLTNQTLTKVAVVGAARGGCFTGDGRILYTSSFQTGLSLVNANGGEPVELTTVDPALHTSHRWPSMIPGSDRFLFSAVSALVGEQANNGLYIGSLDGREPPRRVMASHFSGQVVDGHLLHAKDGTLLAVPFDAEAGETRGETIVLARGLVPDASTWHGQFSASAAGLLALNRPTSAAADVSSTTYSWSLSGDRASFFSIDGLKVTSYATGTPMFSMSLSPNGRTLAMDALSPDGYTDVWLFEALGPSSGEDFRGQPLATPPKPTRLTFLPGAEYLPAWSPDSSEVAFRWDGDGERPRGLYRKRVGGGSETLVRDNQGEDDHVSQWTADGRYLIVTTDTILSSPDNDILAVPLDGGPEIPLVTAPGPQYDGHVSPDGRWLVYVDSTGPAQLLVIPFAPAWPEDRSGERWLVSEHGYEPRWSPDGSQIFFMGMTGTLTAVDVETVGESFSFSPPRSMFQTPWRLDRSYDPRPGPDGETIGFLVVDSDAAAEGPIAVILGWQALLGDG